MRGDEAQRERRLLRGRGRGRGRVWARVVGGAFVLARDVPQRLQGRGAAQGAARHGGACARCALRAARCDQRGASR
eukprot:3209044-Pleurochrysis_carterae.AAC.1